MFMFRLLLHCLSCYVRMIIIIIIIMFFLKFCFKISFKYNIWTFDISHFGCVLLLLLLLLFGGVTLRLTLRGNKWEIHELILFDPTALFKNPASEYATSTQWIISNFSEITVSVGLFLFGF